MNKFSNLIKHFFKREENPVNPSELFHDGDLESPNNVAIPSLPTKWDNIKSIDHSLFVMAASLRHIEIELANCLEEQNRG